MTTDGRNYSTIKVSGGTTVKIEHRDFIPSVTVLAKEYAIHGYPDRYAVFTEYQANTAITKTKLKKNELEHGIFISLILRPSLFPTQVASLGPLSIVALTQALEAYTSNKLEISWVSDLFCDGVKIGGTQIEGKLKDASSYEYIIVTFAARTDEKTFPPRLKDSVKQVFEKDRLSIGMMMAKTVLDKFFSLYSGIKTSDKYQKYYFNKFGLKDAKVKYLDGDKLRFATVTGIDKETLALIIKNKQGDEIRIFKPSSVIIPGRINFTSKIKKEKAKTRKA